MVCITYSPILYAQALEKVVVVVVAVVVGGVVVVVAVAAAVVVIVCIFHDLQGTTHLGSDATLRQPEPSTPESYALAEPCSL